MYRKGSPEADRSKEPHVLVLLVTRLRAVILPQLRHVLRSDQRCPGSEARDDIIGKSRDLCIGIGAAERGHRDGMWRRFDRRPSSNRNPTNHVADLAWLEPDQREKGTVPRQVTQLVCSASYVRWDNGRQDSVPRTTPVLPYPDLSLWQGSKMTSQSELRSRAALCAQLAEREPANRALWMAEAETWARLSTESFPANQGKRRAADNNASTRLTDIRRRSDARGFNMLA